MDIKWAIVGAWVAIWLSCVVGGIILGQLLGNFRPFRGRRELPAKARERWSSLLGAAGFFLPILYWWLMALVWCWEQVT